MNLNSSTHVRVRSMDANHLTRPNVSVPDYLLDDDEAVCRNCGNTLKPWEWTSCEYCQLDNADLYADMKIQDEQEGW